MAQSRSPCATLCARGTGEARSPHVQGRPPRATSGECSQHSGPHQPASTSIRSPRPSQPRHGTFASSALSSSSSASVRPSTAGAGAAAAASTGTSVMESDSRPLLGEPRLISAGDRTRPDSVHEKLQRGDRAEVSAKGESRGRTGCRDRTGRQTWSWQCLFSGRFCEDG